MSFADFKICSDLAPAPGHWKASGPYPVLLDMKQEALFHCSKERIGFPMLLRGFLAFISSFALQDLLIFLRQHPKLVWQQSCLLFKGGWVSCQEKLPFHPAFHVTSQCVRAAPVNTGGLVERPLSRLICEILNWLCFCYGSSMLTRVSWEKR